MLPFSTDQRQVYPTWNKELGLSKRYMICQICFFEVLPISRVRYFACTSPKMHPHLSWGDKSKVSCVVFGLFLAFLLPKAPPFNSLFFYVVSPPVYTCRSAMPSRHEKRPEGTACVGKWTSTRIAVRHPSATMPCQPRQRNRRLVSGCEVLNGWLKDPGKGQYRWIDIYICIHPRNLT